MRPEAKFIMYLAAIYMLTGGSCDSKNPQDTVEIPSGVAILGRMEKEAWDDYVDCGKMARRTAQDPKNICEPQKDVFGDVVPERRVEMQGFRIDRYE